jgi:hypothetical protein
MVSYGHNLLILLSQPSAVLLHLLLLLIAFLFAQPNLPHLILLE